MILFIHEDNAFRHWITHHRQGYLLDGTRKPKIGHLLLHRASCLEVKRVANRGHATTGRRLKACSFDRDELKAWGEEETGVEPAACVHCSPLSDTEVNGEERRHLTRSERVILDYVLDVALIHLEPDATHYRLTVADVAQCLRKTPGQLMPALHHLIDAGMIAVPKVAAGRSSISSRQIIFPTIESLQTLPAFAKMTEAEVAAEVKRLNAD